MSRKTAMYIRTSSSTQSAEIQNFHINPEWDVFRDEGVSGRLSMFDRPAGKKLLAAIEKGKYNEIVITRIDRLGRSLPEILDVISKIHFHKCTIRSLTEGITTLDEKGDITPACSLMLNVLCSISSFQIEQLKQKVFAGIALAKLKNPEKYRGRKPGSSISPEKFLAKPKNQKILELLKQGVSTRSVCRILNVSPTTVSKIKRLTGLRQAA